jgi:hypothetical protein
MNQELKIPKTQCQNADNVEQQPEETAETDSEW